MHLIHRGIVNKLFKENLLISFKQSFKKGYGIETDEGAPGIRSGDYYCYIRDLDGNKVCAFTKISE